MTVFTALIAGTLGLIVGSFLNVVVHRLEHGGSILWDRSKCPFCTHQLAWTDLIPVISFFMLRGRCRYCSSPISLQYPLVEGAMALLAVLVAFHVELVSTLSFGAIGSFLLLFSLSAVFLAILAYDLRHFIIPDVLLVAGGILVVIFLALKAFLGGGISPILSSLLAGLGASAFFWGIWRVSHGRWMGFGDVKLALLLGLLLGFPLIVVSLFLSFFSGAVVGLSLIALKKKSLASEVPFAPFLISSALVSLFWGELLLDWYLALLLI